MEKKGQMQLSFGMIFSILIIIVTLAVAFYVIREFMETGKCAELRVLHENLQREIDTVWRSAAAQVAFQRSVPSSVKSVCFGDPASWDATEQGKERTAFASYRGTDENFFIYPLQCGRAVSVRSLPHVSLQRGFCVPVTKGEVSITIGKASSTAADVSLAP